MPASRIARDLIASGMDAEIHLTIVQASLYTLRRTEDELSVMRKDLDELVSTSRRSNAFESLERYERLVEDINAIDKQVKHAPKIIAEYEIDVRVYHGVRRDRVNADGKSD